MRIGESKSSKAGEKRAKAGMAAVLAAIVVMGKIALAATAAKAPPYLPLNVQVGEKAPDFALPSTDGKTVRLSQYLGHNVLLDFYEGYW